MSIAKFKHLDAIARQIMDKILKLPLTDLETQYVLNELQKFSFTITNSKIKKIKDSRVDELEKISKEMRESNT